MEQAVIRPLTVIGEVTAHILEFNNSARLHEREEMIRFGKYTAKRQRRSYTYGHELTLETLGYSCDVTVYFAAHESFTRNVLGRRGWLDQVRLGIVEYESKLYLSRYGE